MRLEPLEDRRMLSAAPPLAPGPDILESFVPASVVNVHADSAGLLGNAGTGYESKVSGDNRYVVFASNADNLVAGDTNGVKDIFVKDVVNGLIDRVSVGPGGVQGNDASSQPDISADGRFVLFNSDASNLVPGDTNGRKDLFVHDRATGLTERIGWGVDGREPNHEAGWGTISSCGRYVGFGSDASNLVAGDTNGHQDVFWHDRQTGQTRRASVSATGQQVTSWAFAESLSGDGRFVSFVTGSPLVPEDTNSAEDVYVYDSVNGSLERVTHAHDGGQLNAGANCHNTCLSGDGRYVSFQSNASNIATGDTNGYGDIFVADRQTGAIERINVAADGTQADNWSAYAWISDDGRYVSFRSRANNLVDEDTNTVSDVFLYDRDTDTLTLASMNTAGEQADDWSIRPRVSPDGQYVSYYSTGTNLTAGDTNGVGDIFLATNPLWTAPSSPTLFVDDDAAAGGDGNSWATAFVSLQDALDAASMRNTDADPDNNVVDIWVAEGVYTPSERLNPADARSVTFALLPDVALIGGFAGTESSPDERLLLPGGVYANQTILSGDLAGNDMPGVGLSEFNVDASRSDNAYTILYAVEIVGARLDGVTITGGQADGPSGAELHSQHEKCGALYVYGGSLAIDNVLFTRNYGKDWGGAIRARAGAHLSIADTVFESNRAISGGGINADGAVLDITGSLFIRNDAGGGGAMQLWGSTATVTGTCFYDNQKAVEIMTSAADARFFNCIFAENDGGAIYRWSIGRTELTNCTMIQNGEENGRGAIYSANVAGDTGVLLHNTVIARNDGPSGPAEVYGLFNSASSNNLIGVADGATGLDPALNLLGTLATPIDPGLGHFVGVPWTPGALHILPGSPLLDAGSNALLPPEITTDFEGGDRIENGVVDIGAIEGLPPAAPGAVHYVVENLAREVAVDGQISLLEALLAAEYNVAVADAPAGSFGERDRITFAPGVSGTVHIDGEPIELWSKIAIEGPGPDLLTFDAQGLSRVFRFHDSADVELSGMTITGGATFAGDDNGAGILSGGHLSLSGIEFRGNHCVPWGAGGGVYQEGGQLTLRSSSFIDNSAPEHHGGAIYVRETKAVIEDVYFESNSSKLGGAIGQQYNTDAVISDCTFIGNVAVVAGGVLESFRGCTTRLIGCNLYANYASGSFFQDPIAMGAESVGTIINCCLVGNKPYEGWNPSSWSDYIAFGDAENYCNTVYDSYGDAGSNGLHFAEAPAGLYFLRNPDDGGDGWADDPSTTDIDESANNDYGDLRLAPGSPAIDAGDSSLLPLDTFDLDGDGDTAELLPLDCDGNPRVQGASVDLGAFEFQPTGLSGTVWDDLDRDGVQDPGEAGLGGWTVFLDTNRNGLLDTGEASTVTSLGSATPLGYYEFLDLEPGDYAVRLLLPPLCRQTSPTVAVSQETTHTALDLPYGRSDWFAPRLSADGRFVAFTTPTSLVPEDINGEADVYVQDLETGGLELMSRPVGGGQSDAGSWKPEISPDGRYVGFFSEASNLTPDDVDGFFDVFVVDRATGELECITADQDGDALSLRFSGDGRYVAYEYEFDDTIGYNANASRKDSVFLDRQTGERKVLTTGDDGRTGNSITWATEISDDGRYAVFMSRSSNLVPNDTNGDWDVFYYDIQNDTLECLSLTASGYTGSGASERPQLSADGRYVTFHSRASNLDGVPTSGTQNVFVWDSTTDGLTRIAGDGTPYAGCDARRPSISDDGRYIVYTTSNIGSGDTWSSNSADVYVYDQHTGQTECVTVDTSGDRTQDVNAFAFLSGDGHTVTFLSDSGDLVPSEPSPDRLDLFTAVNPLSPPREAAAHQVTLAGGSVVAGCDFGAVKNPLRVSSPADGRDGDYRAGVFTLREALDVALARPGDDAIHFGWQLSGGAITVDPALGELPLHSDLSITGPGRESLTISGGGATGVFKMIDPAVDATIEGLTIADGESPFGGGVMVFRGSVTLRHVDIRDCHATSGGGLFAGGPESRITVEDAVLHGNSAALYGGAAFAVSDATITLTGSTVRGAEFAGPNALVGGALAAYRGGRLEILDSTIADHEATVGGGVYVSRDGASLDLRGDSAMTGNAARLGGAVLVDRTGQATIDAALLHDNVATRGGAIAVQGLGSHLAMTGVTLSDNRAAALGGGVYLTAGATATITGGTIHGAGLATRCLQSAGIGGAVAVENGGNAAIADTQIIDNSANYGGGLFARAAGSTVSLTGVDVSANHAVRLGHQTLLMGGATIEADRLTTTIEDDDPLDIIGAIDWLHTAPESSATFDLEMAEPSEDAEESLAMAARALLFAELGE